MAGYGTPVPLWRDCALLMRALLPLPAQKRRREAPVSAVQVSASCKLRGLRALGRSKCMPDTPPLKATRRGRLFNALLPVLGTASD